jgi:short-subunit dehydrogenase
MMVRPLQDQVVVVTGASSGIGREAALKLAEKGATVVLASRNEVALQEVAAEIRAAGGLAHVVVTDVGVWEQVENLARAAVALFGRIDTWVNDAGTSVYATAEETTVEETQQIVQTNFMGVVHGVKAAVPYMKQQGSGTIINVGSVESRLALPYHSVYAATKHAVKAYTDALRMELMHEHAGITVTLILPAGINTPFFNHARSKLGVLPQPAPPVYKPEVVAQAIVHAAEHPQREIYAGGASKLFSMMERISPTLTDRLMTTRGAMFRLQHSDMPDDGQDTVFRTIPETGRVTGDFGHLVKPSMYTRLFQLTPLWQRLLGLSALAGLAIFVRRPRHEKPQLNTVFQKLRSSKPMRRAVRLRALAR